MSESWRARGHFPWPGPGAGAPPAASVARGRATAPPVLVLSMPRSGSSWVGSVLGAAADAAYLREPLTEIHARRRGGASFFEVDPAAPPDGYRRAGAVAFAGVPRFSAAVVAHREQW